MKRTSLYSLVAVALMLGVSLYAWQHQAPAQEGKKKEDDNRGTLTTTGTATTHVKPDSARVYFRVESYAEDIKAARADNAKAVDRVLAALRNLKIDQLKMKSSDVQVQLVTKNRAQEERLPKILGYHITHTFTVLVENDAAVRLSEDASRVMDTALDNGATGVDQIQFFARDLEKVRRELLTSAVEDALKNARALAAGAKRTINEIATIYGQPQYAANPSNLRYQNAVVPDAGDATPLVAGDLVLTCNVNVSCKYDN